MAKKKNKDAEDQASQLNPGENNDQMEKYSVKTNSKKVNKREALIRVLTIILIILLLFLFGLFACTTYIKSGNFTVTASSELFDAGVALSETKDFTNPQRILEGSKYEEMREGTKPLIPEDIDQHDGSYNVLSDGMYYYTYSFYVKNTGKDDAGYVAKLNMDSVTEGADEALRIMIIKDGKRITYGKPRLGTNNVLEIYADKNFVSNRLVATVTDDDFKAGDIQKITVVIWFEGEDPECVNDILEGEVKLSMDLNVIEPLDK